MMTHTLKARQRNDAELAKNERKIETLNAKRSRVMTKAEQDLAAIDAELVDLKNEERALLAMAEKLRDAGGQL